MIQIKSDNQTRGFATHIAALRRRFVAGVKWWAEHQSWPATDEIRVDRHRSPCG